MAITDEHLKQIVDKLVILKNTSELMIDLAYSSLLLNSQSLAEEVEALENRIDDLYTEFELLVLSVGFTPEESKDFLGLIRLGAITEQIADAAMEIADVVLKGLEPHPILRLVIEEAEETVTKVTVSEDSSFVGKTIREAQIQEETGMWVLVIRRANWWLRPRPNTVIHAGDVLIAAGYAEGEADFESLASGTQKETPDKDS
ncbi:MAG: hypothetical protein IAX21_06890 [Candidatus Bathyarchaeota archaeon]|nr:TrkA C-terminal domain-containing protein [Candidatus Bathyarchaeum tardum]WGM89332.1 MAG: TrkA C-terminal domain-containing protein [Candidatus Bathyarchaeum tardum]WNZ28393.1 MAG: hypothetical protein IAX21_06890 [Candidatus Bathyarchaeota archaeon]